MGAGEAAGRAVIVGTGLIGGSVGMALRRRGWRVAGVDADPARLDGALRLGAADARGFDEHADLVVVATPASRVVDAARQALRRVGPGAVVTDVAGVKAAITAELTDPCFVGGHPMAGSEQEGIEGADPTLFEGATWVLTPTPTTDARAFARVQAVVSSLGGEVLAVAPQLHDDLVAMVSHVPHLVAATLMRVAAAGAAEHAAMLRLAAGGFRDMTRVASGHPGIWPDVCAANAPAILDVLDRVADALGEMRAAIAGADAAALLAMLTSARDARRSLPMRIPAPEALAELRVAVDDRPGTLAAVTTMAGRLGVNVADMEIAHSAEGARGVLILIVDAAEADRLREALVEAGFRPGIRALA